jgi:hypothetical protein
MKKKRRSIEGDKSRFVNKKRERTVTLLCVFPMFVCIV